MSLKESEMVIGRRVMVPAERVPDQYPWAERYGTIVEIDQFLDLEAWIRVRLDGEMAHVISCRLAELDHE